MKLSLRRPTVLLAASVATLAVALPSTAPAHQQRAKEYRLAQHAVPAGMATGPDGAVYAADGSLGRLWRVSTKGKVSSIPVGSGPASVASGSDGALWVTDRTTAEIHRVAGQGAITTYQLPDRSSFPTDIVAGPDGALWFLESHGHRIGRITTAGAITEYDIPTPGAFASGLTVGPDGALWFTESGGNQVGRITTSGELTEYPLDTPDALPGAIVSAGGALYVAELNGNAITRMDTSGNMTARYALPRENATPVALAATDHGVWISEHSTGLLTPMSLTGRFGRPVRSNSAPDAVVIGADGDLWYGSGNESRIGRVDIGW